jgi:hypothetical protein
MLLPAAKTMNIWHSLIMLRRNDYTSFMSEEKQAYLEKQLILSN